MAGDLAQQKCVACEGSETPFTTSKALQWLSDVDEGWELTQDATKITRECGFTDFSASMAFVNRVAAIAEEEGHHPDIHIHYNRVRLELWTHAIGGLFDNDFILAAKIDEVVTVKH